ncbi:hypothetical protein BDN72DRAFT_849496 [Pluteus cervinus]|uniref:Uncharacterized protein n=1 Tax=Pluteus cervinus TaxID=181527 RepID=A0ACD3A8I8_9AGAR|nr:hypothetical protein BDN72DRAFT_849496 [Pluteus cervinus]
MSDEVVGGLNPSAMGAVELGTLLALMVHGGSMTQFVTYFKRYQDDPFGMRLTIAAIAFASLAHVICIMSALYNITISKLDKPTQPFALPVMYPIALFFSSAIHFLVQITYCYRIYKFSKNYVVPIICFLAAGYGLVATTIFAGGYPLTTFQDQLRYQYSLFWVITSVFVNTSVLDVLIAGSMCWYLIKGHQDALRRTARVMEKLVAWTIQSGVITSILAIAIVATFVNDMPSNIWVGLTVFSTPVYPAALLALLNERQQLSREVDKTVSLAFIEDDPTITFAVPPPPPENVV